jgi:hypothetical protein
MARSSARLNADPTKVTGPNIVRAEPGRIRPITYTVDVVNSFHEGRGELRVRCDHLDIDEQRTSVGRGRPGRARVTVAVPDTAALGDYTLEIILKAWLRSAGGIGHRLARIMTLRVVDAGTAGGKPTKTGQRTGDPAMGGVVVALRFTGIDEREDWSHRVVRMIEDVPLQVLAEIQEQYAEPAALGDQPIPAMMMNQN